MSTTSVPAPAINLARRQDLFSSHIVVTALKQSVLMLRPDVQWKNPVMFVVEIGAVLTLLYVIQIALGNVSSAASLGYFIALDAWLFLTVLFANFATAIAEERGKAQAETLRKTRGPAQSGRGPARSNTPRSALSRRRTSARITGRWNSRARAKGSRILRVR